MMLLPVSTATIRQMFRYACVGGAGLCLHLGSTTFLVEVWDVPYTIAFFGGLPFTYTGRFLLDKYWTFGK